MSQEQIKKLCCNRCGHIQPRNEAVCKNCGEDLMLYGRLITVSESVSKYDSDNIKNKQVTPSRISNFSKEEYPERNKRVREKRGKGSSFLSPKCLIGLISVLAVVAVAVVLLVLIGNRKKPAESIAPAPAQGISEQKAVLPDFACFAENFVDESSVSSKNGVNTHIFTNVSGENLREVFHQYKTLMESSYPYKLLGTAEKSDSGMNVEYYVYQYTGPDSIPEMSQKIGGYEHLGSGHVWLAYMYNQDAAAVVIDAADAITFVNNGNRAGSNPGIAQTQGGSGTMVAGEADFGFFNQIPANALPDLVYWSDAKAAYRDEPVKKDIQYFYYQADESLIQSYVTMLQNNGFTLVDTHTQEYKGSAFYSWGFTCDGAPGAKKIGLQFKDTPCHVSLYYANHNGQYTMNVSNDIMVCDTGLRMDGRRVDLTPAGTSAGAGLTKMADGSYQTSDGRLCAAMGTAMVLRDGVPYTTDAFYTQEDGSEILKIENFHRNEGIYFEAPLNSLLQGDVLTQRDLRRWRWRDCKSIGDLEGFRWDGAVLAMPRDGKWLGATYNDSVYQSLTFRVMAYDSGGAAVFYIHAEFHDGEPREIEALCVVDTSSRSGNIKNATYIKVGNTATLKYTHRENCTAYNTFEWTIIEGADKIVINSGWDSCDVTALSPGVAAVQVKYDYSKEEPDPLTGIMRTVPHSKTQVYTFIIE